MRFKTIFPTSLPTIAFLAIVIFFYAINAFAQTEINGVFDNRVPYVVESAVFIPGTDPNIDTNIYSKLKWVQDGPILVPKPNGNGIIRLAQYVDQISIQIKISFNEKLDNDPSKKPVIKLKKTGDSNITTLNLTKDSINELIWISDSYTASAGEYTITVENAYDLAGNRLDSNPGTIAKRSESNPSQWSRYETNSGAFTDSNHVFYVSAAKKELPIGFNASYNSPLVRTTYDSDSKIWQIKDGNVGIIYGYGERKLGFSFDSTSEQKAVYRRDNADDPGNTKLTISAGSISSGWIYFPQQTEALKNTTVVFIPDQNLFAQTALERYDKCKVYCRLYFSLCCGGKYHFSC